MRHSFTLIELVICCALGAVILLGLQSAVFIAARAIPGVSRIPDQSAVGAALQRLDLDLAQALSITGATASSLSVIVPDQTGDGAADTITYSWSGQAGAPLLRQLNGYAPEPVLTHLVALSFALQTTAIPAGTSYVESNETLLAGYTSATSTGSWSIDAAAWVCQVLPVSIPADAVDFRTTRLVVIMSKDGSDVGTTQFELRAGRADRPTTVVHARASLAESSLSAAAASVSINLASSTTIARTDPICLVILPSSGSPSGQVRTRTTGAPISAGAWSTSTNNGAIWSGAPGRALHYQLYGVYRTVESTPPQTRATRIGVALQTLGGRRTETSVMLSANPSAP